MEFPGNPVSKDELKADPFAPSISQPEGPVFPGDPVDSDAIPNQPEKYTPSVEYDPSKSGASFNNVRAGIEAIEYLQKQGQADSFVDHLTLSGLKAFQTGRIVSPVLSNLDMETLKGRTLAVSKGVVRAIDGGKQFSLSMLESIGAVPEGTTKEFTNAVFADRKEFEKAFKDEFGDDIGFDLMEIAGQTAPLLVLRGGGAGKSALAQFATKVASNTGAGMLGGAVQFVDPNSKFGRLFNTIVGGVIGGVLTAAIETPALAKQIFGSRIREFSKTPFFKAGEKLDDATGIKTTLGMKSGDPVTLSLEKTAATSNKGAVLSLKEANERSKQVLKFFSTLKKKIANNIKPDAEVISANLEQNADDFVKMARTVRRGNWDKITAAAKKMVQQSDGNGNSRIIDISDSIDDINNYVSGLKTTESAPSEIKYWTRILDKWRKQGNALSIDEYNQWMTSIRDAKGSGIFSMEKGSVASKQGKVLATQLEKTFLDSIDNVGGDVGDTLRAARTQWHQDSIPISELKNSVFGKLFGGYGQPVPEAAMTKINKLPESQAKILVNVLKKTGDDQTLRELNALLIDDALKSSISNRNAANMTGLDVGKLVDKLSTGPAKYISNIGPDEAKGLKNGMAQLRRILQAAQGEGGSPGQLSRVQEVARIAGNIPNPKAGSVFLSGIVGKVGFQKMIANALLTPEGRQSLLTFGNAKASSATLTQSFNTLINLALEEDE